MFWGRFSSFLVSWTALIVYFPILILFCDNSRLLCANDRRSGITIAFYPKKSTNIIFSKKLPKIKFFIKYNYFFLYFWWFFVFGVLNSLECPWSCIFQCCIPTCIEYNMVIIPWSFSSMELLSNVIFTIIWGVIRLIKSNIATIHCYRTVTIRMWNYSKVLYTIFSKHSKSLGSIITKLCWLKEGTFSHFLACFFFERKNTHTSSSCTWRRSCAILSDSTGSDTPLHFDFTFYLNVHLRATGGNGHIFKWA